MRDNKGRFIEESPEQRFWKYVNKKTDDECWEWIGAKDKDGYGHIGLGGSELVCSRLSWEIHHGQIPSNLMVLHRCDNPPCVNPSHLFLGTHEDNMKDMSRKMGRRCAGNKVSSKNGKSHNRNKGEENPHSRFRNVDIVEIRKLAEGGASMYEIARIYNTGKSTIQSIVHKRSWAHIA